MLTKLMLSIFMTFLEMSIKSSDKARKKRNEVDKKLYTAIEVADKVMVEGIEQAEKVQELEYAEAGLVYQGLLEESSNRYSKKVDKLVSKKEIAQVKRVENLDKHRDLSLKTNALSNIKQSINLNTPVR